MRPGRFGRYAIRTADGVQEAAYLPIGGIEQYIRVRGPEPCCGFAGGRSGICRPSTAGRLRWGDWPPRS